MAKLNKILQGDALTVLKTMPDECVNMCVTSPPYWGLRDYGTAKWEGGDQGCNHIAGSFASSKSGLHDGAGCSENEKVRIGGMPFRDICGKCGAVRIDSQLGLEKTPEEYVSKMVEIFREVRRVLKPDGTLWLNLGDSYANDTKWGGTTGGKHVSALHGEPIGRAKRDTGLKPKDLCGIPWRVAFALQANGWYLRQDIIWQKPNPMPESVTDRCTKAHEYIFLMSKNQRYYYDAEAIKEPAAYPNDKRRPLGSKGAWQMDGRKQGENGGGVEYEHDTETRNRRSVWTIPTAPYKEAHFATFPEDLIVPCIKAGCPEGGIVLDPFMGAGTTALVSLKLSRNFIGIELNSEYIKLINKRIEPLLIQGGLF